MVRLAMGGQFDFQKFDPFDLWCQKKLQWLLDELESQLIIDVAKFQHSHWLGLAANAKTIETTVNEWRANAGKTLNIFLTHTYPWLKDKIGEAGTVTSQEQELKAYRETWGKPGDQKYDTMIAEDMAILRRKPTELEITRYYNGLLGKRA